MLSGLSVFQIGTCFSDLNFCATAEDKASRVKLSDLHQDVRHQYQQMSEMINEYSVIRVRCNSNLQKKHVCKTDHSLIQGKLQNEEDCAMNSKETCILLLYYKCERYRKKHILK